MRDLKNAAGAWVDELPSVLWGLRTTPNRSTGRTPFFLVYGAEAVLPSDLLHNAPRVELFSEAEQARQDSVDLLEEEREMALIRSTIYQQDLRRFHDQEYEGSGLSIRRLGSSSGSTETTQARSNLGRPLHRHQSSPQRSIPSLQYRASERRATGLEGGAAPPLLYLNTRSNKM